MDTAVAPDLVARFRTCLARAGCPAEDRLGVAVSGGPDSLALLLLAHASLGKRCVAATVDHGLRPESRAEAAMVAQVCRDRGIDHAILTTTVPSGNVQSAARIARYAALGGWAGSRGLGAVATAHHRDDQAETLLMRLNRGSGVAGLAGVRLRSRRDADGITLVRPLLGWSKAELQEIAERTGLEPARDPSNERDAFDRVRVRKGLAGAGWLDPDGIARSAAALADADEALEWAARREWVERVEGGPAGLRYSPLPVREIRLRIIARAIAEVGGGTARGSAVAELDQALMEGRGGTLGGALLRTDGAVWTIEPEPQRRTG